MEVSSFNVFNKVLRRTARDSSCMQMIFDMHVYCENVGNLKNCAKIDSYRATFGLQPRMTTLFLIV
jgi:hypothetical protein